MNDDEKIQELLNFFKALADPNRLKIIGLLARQDLSVEQMAEMLSLASSTVSHHLSRLNKAGLVSARAEGYYNIYQLNAGKLASLSKELLTPEQLPTFVKEIDMDAYDQKVVKNFTNPDGTLKAIPGQMKKLTAILKYILPEFEADRKYPEKEVNQILERYHEDYAQLRRDLIDTGLMKRENGIYWKVEQPV
ncbi:MAG: metalloregulator ArsR/SmtB family transcription factor [Anaerolineaceae bacterium]|jgi:predicted transcriptional regulator|nr:metalloregulator ArsR/SmtB family transcription factor [Anaerolineaceae bacterium]